MGDGRRATGNECRYGYVRKGREKEATLDSIIVEGLSGEERLFDPFSRRAKIYIRAKAALAKARIWLH